MPPSTHVKTAESTMLVELLAGMGTPHDKIALLLHIGRDKLHELYEFQLQTGRTKVDSIVYSKLMENIKKGKEASIIFYLKARLNWSERNVVEVEGLPPVVFNVQFGNKPAAPLPQSEKDKLTAYHKPGKVIDHEPRGESQD